MSAPPRVVGHPATRTRRSRRQLRASPDNPRTGRGIKGQVIYQVLTPGLLCNFIGFHRTPRFRHGSQSGPEFQRLSTVTESGCEPAHQSHSVKAGPPNFRQIANDLAIRGAVSPAAECSPSVCRRSPGHSNTKVTQTTQSQVRQPSDRSCTCGPTRTKPVSMPLEYRVHILPASQHRPIDPIPDPQLQIFRTRQRSTLRQHLQHRLPIKPPSQRTTLLVSPLPFFSLPEEEGYKGIKGQVIYRGLTPGPLHEFIDFHRTPRFRHGSQPGPEFQRLSNVTESGHEPALQGHSAKAGPSHLWPDHQ